MLLKDWIKNSDLSHQESYYLAKNILETEDLSVLLNDFVLNVLNYCKELRMQNIPLAKIIEKKCFYKETFVTTYDTLDPRPETEFLIEEVLKFEQKPRTILEIGTGTGCIILSLLKELIKSKGIATDICSKAINIAKINAKILKLNNKIQFVNTNFADNITQDVDLIISNPPYIPLDYNLSSETLYDPKISLFGDINTYINLIKSIKVNFKYLVLEVPHYLVEEVALFAQTYYVNSKIKYKEIYNSQIYYFQITNYF